MIRGSGGEEGWAGLAFGAMRCDAIQYKQSVGETEGMDVGG